MIITSYYLIVKRRWKWNPGWKYMAIEGIIYFGVMGIIIAILEG